MRLMSDVVGNMFKRGDTMLLNEYMQEPDRTDSMDWRGKGRNGLGNGISMEGMEI